jgi:uncharacterized protein YndB with AHSA1/START domain
MALSVKLDADPQLDLVLERIVDVPPRLVWAAWTRPEYVTQWFTPAPWQTLACEIDLRPGGIFSTVMKGPDTPSFTNTGCFLEIVENELLVWTGARGPGFRPLPSTAVHPFLMTAFIALEPSGAGTKYSVLIKHGDAIGRARHEQMGFHTGWGKALDQLVALAHTMEAGRGP